MSEPDAVPLPRAGEVFFDVRGEARTMRLSWYADSAVAVFSIWHANRCTGTFRLPFADLDRMIATLQDGPPGQAGAGRRAGMPGYLDESGGYGPADGYLAGEYGAAEYGAGEYEAGAYGAGDYDAAGPGPAGYPAADYADVGYGSSGYPAQWPGEVGADGYGSGDYVVGAYGAEAYEGADYGTAEYVGAGYHGADYAPGGEYAGADYAADEYGPGDYGPGDYGPDEYPDYAADGYAADEFATGTYQSGADPTADGATDGIGYQSAAQSWAGGNGQSGFADQPGTAGLARPALEAVGRYGDVEPIGRLGEGRVGAGRHRGADLPADSGAESFAAESFGAESFAAEPGWDERNGDRADLPAVSGQWLPAPAAASRSGAEETAGGPDLTGIPSVPAGNTSARR